MSKEVFVTGVTGYIGHYVAKELAALGWSVSALYRGCVQPSNPSIKWIKAPGELSPDFYIDLFSRNNFSVIVHLATKFIKQHASKQLVDLFNSNIVLPTVLAEAAVENGVSRFVNICTSWQFNEAGIYSPSNLYAASKEAAKNLLEFYNNSGKLDVFNIYLTDTYGPDDPRPKLFSLLEESYYNNKSIEMTKGEQIIDPVYVKDASRAICLVVQDSFMKDQCNGGEFQVRGMEPATVRSVVTEWIEVTGKSIDINWGGLPYRDNEVMRPWLSGQLVSNWQPELKRKDRMRQLFGLQAT